MLYDERYHGRFVSMDTAADLLHSIAPAGSVMTKKFLENSAWKKGDYRVDITLGELIEGIPDGTVMAVRGIRLRGSSRFTAVGCFSSLDAVPGDDVIRLLIEGQEQRLPSRRPFNIPAEVQNHFNSYASSFFSMKEHVSAMPTPNKKKDLTKRNRPGSAPSTTSSSRSKRRQPGTPGSPPTPKTPTPPTPPDPSIEIKRLERTLDN
jgi:hypothetical protein